MKSQILALLATEICELVVDWKEQWPVALKSSGYAHLPIALDRQLANLCIVIPYYANHLLSHNYCEKFPEYINFHIHPYSIELDLLMPFRGACMRV